MGAVGVAFADHVQIAQGIITDQMQQTFDSLTLSLTEDLTSVSKEVPTTRVVAATYPNAPENNWGKPIPMAWGDFDAKTDIGTIPTTGAEFDRYFVKGHFPAIITDRWNATGGYVDARPDQTATTFGFLSTKHVYYYGDNKYSPCEDSNVNKTTGTPLLTFTGNTWRNYEQLGNAESADQDNDFSTAETYTVDGTYTIEAAFKIPKIAKLGELISISVIIDFGTFSGTNPIVDSGFPFYLLMDGGSPQQIVWDDGDKTVAITTSFTTAKKAAWDFETGFSIIMDDTGAGGSAGDQSFEINEIGLEIAYTPSQTFTKQYAPSLVGGNTRRIRYRKVEVPEVTDYIYYAGRGREFGAWVDADSRDNGYNSTDLIENPVYIIEDILRTELGLGSTEIDYASFDAVGNTTNGTIANTFDMAVSAIEFAFCQYQYIDAWELCKEIAASCGCILFLSGSGKIKIISRERDEDYTSADKTISYDEIGNINPGITQLSKVRNKVSVRYNMDYATDTLTATTAEAEDSTSQGNGATGINSTQELVIDNRFTLDSATATGYSTALLDWLAYRKKTLKFDILSSKYNDLEIGDTLDFSGWPSTFKIYGNTITSTDIYMITNIQKYPNGCSINCQEVSEVSD